MVKGDELRKEKNLDDQHTHKKKSNRIIKVLSAAAVAAFLNLFGQNADAQNLKDSPKKENLEQVDANNKSKKENTEQIDVGLDVLNSIQQKTGVKLPNRYEGRVREFINYSKVFENKDAKEFIENFIVKEMKEDWGISKQHQQFFGWYAVCLVLENEDLYNDGDGNEKMLEDFENAVELIDNCCDNFRNEFEEYIENKSNEFNARISDANARISDAIHGTIKLDSIWVTTYMKEFYDTYNKDPSIIKQEDIDFMKKSTKEVIIECKKYGIDHEALILESVGGNKEEYDKMLRFYGIKE